MSGTPLTTLMCLNLLCTKMSLRQPPGKTLLLNNLTGQNFSLLKLPITDFYLYPDALATQVAAKTPRLFSQGYICCGPPTF